jgi:hypothetical protein
MSRAMPLGARAMPPGNALGWGVDDVEWWMLSLEIDGKEEIAQVLREELITGELLLAFEDKHDIRRGLGIGLGKAVRVWQAIEVLADESGKVDVKTFAEEVLNKCEMSRLVVEVAVPAWGVVEVAQWARTSGIDGGDAVALKLLEEDIDGPALLLFEDKYDIKRGLCVNLGTATILWEAILHLKAARQEFLRNQLARQEFLAHVVPRAVGDSVTRAGIAPKLGRARIRLH